MLLIYQFIEIHPEILPSTVNMLFHNFKQIANKLKHILQKLNMQASRSDTCFVHLQAIVLIVVRFLKPFKRILIH